VHGLSCITKGCANDVGDQEGLSVVTPFSVVMPIPSLVDSQLGLGGTFLSILSKASGNDWSERASLSTLLVTESPLGRLGNRSGTTPGPMLTVLEGGFFGLGEI
jgi:hypothetical protein